MAAELITYKTVEMCRDALLKMGLQELKFKKILNHEEEHYKKAVELGYTPLIGIRMIPDCPPVILTGFVDFDGSIPKGQDMIDILLAPKQPGKDDHNLAYKIRNLTI